jgi:RsmE family RNA methyltransferase
MNLLLLEPEHLTSSQTARVTGRRLEHLLKVHRAQVGDSLRIGLLNGDMGAGTITRLDTEVAEIRFELNQTPPKSLPLTLVVGLPRPQMLKRILQTIATMGVKHLIFVHSQRVEKSFWQTPQLQPQAIHEQLILGLEQGVDTCLPQIELVQRFKPFVEDRLPELAKNKRALVAHPRRALDCPPASEEETVLLIGPEGGFIDYEIDCLEQAGCQAIHLGERILRVETAVPVLLAKLFS